MPARRTQRGFASSTFFRASISRQRAYCARSDSVVSAGSRTCVRSSPFNQKRYCKPILGEKIRYHREKAFTERLLPPPTVPAMDMDLHFARVQQRWREVEGELPPGEALDIGALAHDLTELPDLNVAPVANVAETLLNFFAPSPAARGGAIDAAPDNDGVLADAPTPAECAVEPATDR